MRLIDRGDINNCSLDFCINFGVVDFDVYHSFCCEKLVLPWLDLEIFSIV
jgi:hypothetical protein